MKQRELASKQANMVAEENALLERVKKAKEELAEVEAKKKKAEAKAS